MPAITPFRVEIPQADLDDLRDRLDRVRWPDELPGVGWDLGIPLGRMRGSTSCTSGHPIPMRCHCSTSDSWLAQS